MSTHRDVAGQDDGNKVVHQNVRTYITHNKGGKWEPIKAPAVNAEGKKLNCFLDEGCSLNL